MPHPNRGWQLRFAWEQRLKETNGRAKVQRMPAPRPPSAQERAHMEFTMRTYLRPARDMVEEKIKPRLNNWFREANPGVRLDSWDDEATTTVEGIREVLALAAADGATDAFLRELAASLVAFSGAEVKRRVEASIGIDVFSSIPRGVAAKAKAWTTDNVRLIKSIPGQYLDRVEALLLREIQASTQPSVIAGMLDAEYGIGTRRAALIAQDQTNKFLSATTRARHQELGITRYVWNDLNDSRVRPSHRARSGKIFLYSQPPPDGHPGHPIRCRCGEDPIIEDVLGVEPRQAPSRQRQAPSI